MREYLEAYGFHFSKKLYEWAVSKMKVKDETTGKEKKLEPWSKDEVDDMLKANGITIEHDKGYDVAYVANMLKADFYKKSLVDEAHLCKHIKCYLDDIDGDHGTDGAGGVDFRTLLDVLGQGAAERTIRDVHASIAQNQYTVSNVHIQALSTV